MKSIETYLMVPEEAVVEAAKTSQLKWLRSLLDEHGDKVRDEAMITSAGEGCIPAVRTLLFEVIGPQSGILNEKSCKVIAEAATAAAAKGYLVVVGMLLLQLEADTEHDDDFEGEGDSDDDGDDTDLPSRNGAWNVLDVATANEHLEVVKFAAEYARDTAVTPAYEFCDALNLAVRGGHLEVVEFLLESGRYTWLYAESFKLAFDNGQDAIVELISARSLETKDTTLFCCTATSGNLKLVEYLYDKGHNRPALINYAFEKAAARGHTDVVAFLLDRGSLSPNSIELTFKGASDDERIYRVQTKLLLERCPISSCAFNLAFECTAVAGFSATWKYLYDQHRASPQSLARAFERTQTAEILKLMYVNDDIPASSVAVAFKTIGGCGTIGGQYDYPGEDRLELLGLMYKEFQIPAEAVNEVFKQAAATLHPKILQMLGNDPRLAPDVRSVAVEKAVVTGPVHLFQVLFRTMGLLSDEASQNVLRAASTGDLGRMKFLLSQPGIARTVIREAIMISAHRDRNGVARCLCRHQEWPLKLFQDALQVTRHKRLKKYLRARIALRQKGK